MIARTPFIRLLEAIVESLELVDYQTDVGILSNVRHHRNRATADEEKCCVAVMFESDEKAGDDQYHNAHETVRHLNFSMVIDAPLASEDTGDDLTGFGDLAAIAAASIRGLRGEATPIGLLSDWIIPGDFTPDENSSPDEGRLVCALTVVYRVRTDDQNILLAQGEMG